MSKATESRIPLSRTRLEQLRSLKRGGENYDSLLAKMIRQYDPDQGQ
jgi:hypothetical protein